MCEVWCELERQPLLTFSSNPSGVGEGGGMIQDKKNLELQKRET